MTAAGAAIGRQYLTFRRQLARVDMSPRDKVAYVAARMLELARLSPAVRVRRLAILELREPPAPVGRLRDLEVRLGGVADVAGVSAVDQTPAELVRARLDQGNLVFLGVMDGNILCHAWFNPGPTPCPDHDVTWALDAGTFWSHGVAAAPEAQGAGVLVQAFQMALGTLFAERGARRVGCAVCPDNGPAIRLRQHLGFRRLGTTTSLALPGLIVIRCTVVGTRRHWLVRRGQRPLVTFPPMSMLRLQ